VTRGSIWALSLLVLGVLFAWPLPTGWFRSMFPGVRPFGHDPNVVAGVAVFLVALLWAIWRRPPTRHPDGTPIAASRLVNWLVVTCSVGGPLVGWYLYDAFSPGDIYMRPVVFGVGAALFSLLVFIGYAAFHVLVRRPGRAALLAVVYPATLVLAATIGPRWVTSRPPVPDTIVHSALPNGRLVKSSTALPELPPSNAFDGRADTVWGSGGFAPAWIEIDLGRPSTITQIRLLVAQSPAGETIHRAIGISSSGKEGQLAEFRGVTTEGDWLTVTLTTPVFDIQSIRITTLASPSWVAWRQIEIVTDPP